MMKPSELRYRSGLPIEFVIGLVLFAFFGAFFLDDFIGFDPAGILSGEGEAITGATVLGVAGLGIALLAACISLIVGQANRVSSARQYLAEASIQVSDGQDHTDRLLRRFSEKTPASSAVRDSASEKSQR